MGIFYSFHNRPKGRGGAEMLTHLKKDFRQIVRQAKIVQELGQAEGAIDSKEYWDKRERLKCKLKSFLDCDFSVLTGKQMITFLSLCNTYRPREPWQMMRDIGMLDDKIKEQRK